MQSTKQNLDKKEIENIKTLVRQSARWTVASEQDKNPLIAILHANYGAGYLWALSDIYYPEEIEAATGVNYRYLKKKVSECQDKAVKKLAAACPNFAPKKSFLMEIAGEA